MQRRVRTPKSNAFRPQVDGLEGRQLLSIVPASPKAADITMNVGTSTVTFRTIGSFTATNIDQLNNDTAATGEAPFDAVVAIDDGGASNLYNPTPTVTAEADQYGMTGKFSIDWGNKYDVIGAVLMPNADYTRYSIELAYRPLVPGDYKYAVVIMGADGSNVTLTGTIHAVGPAQSTGGSTYLPQGPLLTSTTNVDLSTLYN